MTLDEFFSDLAKYTEETGTQWFKYYWGGASKIRCGNGFNCPISFVATQKTGIGYDSLEVWSAYSEIGLEKEDAQRIVNAADERCEHSKYVRERLLKATNLV